MHETHLERLRDVQELLIRRAGNAGHSQRRLWSGGSECVEGGRQDQHRVSAQSRAAVNLEVIIQSFASLDRQIVWTPDQGSARNVLLEQELEPATVAATSHSWVLLTCAQSVSLWMPMVQKQKKWLWARSE